MTNPDEIRATASATYKQWLDALSDMRQISDKTERQHHLEYMTSIHRYATHLMDNYKEQLFHQQQNQLRIITCRPVAHHIIQTKNNSVLVK